MEFRNGTPHAMENSIQIQGSWVPITRPKPEQIQGSWMPVIPSKPEQTNRTTSTQWLNPGASSNGLIQENTYQLPVAPSYSTSATTQFNSAALVDQVPDNNNWRAALAAQTQVSSLNSYEVALRNAEARWNKTPNTHILGSTDTSAPTAAQKGSNVARMQPPISYSQIDGSSNGQQQSYLAKNLSNINQALLQGLNPSSSKNTICLPGMPLYGFPFPYHATSDCNTTMKTNADAVPNGSMQFQTVPVTPDWGMKAKTSQTVENKGPLANSRTSREREHDNSLQPSVSITALAKGSIHPCNNGILLQSTIDSMQANIPSPPVQEIPNHSQISFPNTLSTPMKETHNPNKVEEHHIDLNKTPQQKPKRKKHRPKVIKEDKDKRTPKPVTPNQAVNKENPGGKRKYVRTASSKVSVTISANATKTVDSDGRMRKRSCRRALNFNQEDKAGGGNPKTVQVHQNIQNNSNGVNSSVASYTRAFSLEAMAEYHDRSTAGIDCSHGSTSTLQVAQGLAVVNSPAGMAFNHNHPMAQKQDHFIPLPRHQDTLQPFAMEEQSMEHMKTLAVNRHGGCSSPGINIGCSSLTTHIHQNIHPNEIHQRINPTKAGESNHLSTRPTNLQNGLQSMNETNNRSHVMLDESNHTQRGSKKEHRHTVDDAHLHSMNPFVAHKFASQACQGIIQHNEYSGRSSDQNMKFPHNYKKMRAEMRDNGPIPNMPPPATVRNDSSSVSEVVANQLLTSDTRSSPLCNLLVGKKKPQNRNKNTTNDVQSGSMAAKHNSLVPNISREVFSCLSDQNVINHKELQAPKSITALGNERATKERSDRPVQVHDLESLTAATIECHYQPPTPIQPVLACDGRQVSTTFRRPQAPMETLVENNYEKMTTNGTAKEPVPPANSKSFASTNLVNQQEHKDDTYICCPSSLKSRVTASSSKHSHSRSLETAPINHIHNCQSCSNTQQVLGASFPSQVITSQAEPVDNLVQRFENLNINGDSNTNKAEAKSALVLYKGDSKMVPYGGPSYPNKKRHPRPKVDLDQETERVWKLLMWKEGNDDAGMDTKKEKWWEEERRVFRGRADSFIARMHLVQGDRRFSVWKGSVVDSVVGVFLTQNVSDHLSSSAYMALAARFPLKSRSPTCNREGSGTSVEVKNVPFPSSKNHKEQMKMPNQRLYTRGFITINEVDGLEEKEIRSCNESFGRNMGVNLEDCSEGKCFAAHQIGPKICQESPQNKTDTASTLADSATLADAEDRKSIEDVFSPQISTISSQNSKDSTFQATDRFGMSSNSNYEAEKLINRLECNDLDSSISFMELLQMDGTNMFKEFYMNENGNIPHKENLDGVRNKCDKKKSCIGTEYQIGSWPSISTTSRNHLHAQVEIEGMKSIHSDHYYLHIGNISGAELQNVEVSGEGKRSSLPSTISGITEMRNNFSTGKGINSTTEDTVKFAVDREPFSNAQTTMGGDSCRPTRHQVHPPTSYAKANTHYAAECSSLVDNQTGTVRNVTESSQNYEVHSSKNSSAETIKNDLKGKRRIRAEKNRPFDWDSLRKQTFRNSPEKERSSNTMDSVDWEAVRCADIEEIAETIRERGMNHMLSERIKDFLNRLVSEHGSINLEWIRDVPPDKAKDYLLSIRGLGLKSVECVRLLTLHHLAFPVDTNVGRICVRLGWVPLQPLPESLQLHLLEMYPMLETIQKYLWPRLCTLDQRTLYELHYQLITFGKVFCTKNKPNCNACPMRAECKHFASAFASARLALPGPEEKSIVSSVAQITSEHDHRQVAHPMLLPPSKKNPISQRGSGIRQCEPIIEEPATPEPEGFDTSESAIEDAFWTEDPDEIPTIKLNLKELTQNVQNYMLENAELQESDMSKALVALTQKAASIPMPKLKNVSRLRTEHQVYELPDSHPLLAALGRREPDDPCPYLLAIWTPGETAQSIQPPETCCSSQNTGNLCSKKTCFACNSTREAKAQTVRGTFLIPCRTAMKGSFPLNGTYFQVNEVFADNDSSVCPIDVPRAWIWNLPRRTVYFGTSVSTIFKGLSTEKIQQCFWRGFVCVRGFDQKILAPRPLVSRFHFPASKLARTKKTSAELE